MAKNSSTVQKFLEDLARKTIPRAYLDFLEVQDIKRKTSGDPHAQLNPWDIAFYGGIQLQNKYKVSAD